MTIKLYQINYRKLGVTLSEINVSFLKVVVIIFLDHFSKFTPTHKLEYSTKCLCDVHTVLSKKVTVHGYMARF